MYPGSVRDTPLAATNKVPGDRRLIDSGPGGGPRRSVLDGMLSRRTLSRHGTA